MPLNKCPVINFRGAIYKTTFAVGFSFIVFGVDFYFLGIHNSAWGLVFYTAIVAVLLVVFRYLMDTEGKWFFYNNNKKFIERLQESLTEELDSIKDIRITEEIKSLCIRMNNCKNLTSYGELGKINFDKATSTLSSINQLWSSVYAALIVSVPLSLLVKITDNANYGGPMILLTIVCASFIFVSVFMNLKAIEYKGKYIQYYSAEYIYCYCDTEKKEISSLTHDDFKKIVSVMRMRTAFETDEIKKGVIMHLYLVEQQEYIWIKDIFPKNG